MNPFTIEQKRIELLNSLPHSFGGTKLWQLFDFYKILIESNNHILFNAYSDEFLDDFIAELNLYTTFYQTPELTQSVIWLADKLSFNCKSREKKSELTRLTNDLTISLKTLESILAGNNVALSSRISFPLIERSNNQQIENTLGILESVKIKISKAKTADSFLVIPSQQKMDEFLEQQIKRSFYFALKNLADNYGKIKSHHEVIIYFENRSACYEGNSLGIALTVGFIEELTKFYNLPYLVYIKENITSTGGIEANGNIIPILGNHIQNKVKIVFYSPIEYFIIPKADESKAREKLLALKEQYPNRNLNLVPVENFSELLDRRSLIDIKKQFPIARAAKVIKRNRFATLLLFLVILILTFFYIYEYDDNPAKINLTSRGYSICNKNDKVLWSIKINASTFEYLQSNPGYFEIQIRIIDIDNDGINEVLYSNNPVSPFAETYLTEALVVLNNKGKLISHFSFNHIVKSQREIMPPPYGIHLFDTLTSHNSKCILIAANNRDSYASALFIFDLKNNKIIGDTLWNSGHFVDARLLDIDRDNVDEIVSIALNNGFRQAELFITGIDKLHGQIPTTSEYKLFNLPTAKLRGLFLFPNTDYDNHMNKGGLACLERGIMRNDELGLIRFFAIAGADRSKGMFIAYDYLRNNFTFAIGNEFRYTRDSLVTLGLLKKPLTDTGEYRELLRKQISAWDGKSFIPLDEWRNKRAAK